MSNGADAALLREDDHRPASLSDLLGRVGGELETLTHLIGEMQSGLSPLLIEAASREPDAYRYAQNLDLVWQTLASLAQVMFRSAQGGSGASVPDLERIVADLPLSDVARRLSGRSVEAIDDSFDLF